MAGGMEKPKVTHNSSRILKLMIVVIYFLCQERERERKKTNNNKKNQQKNTNLASLSIVLNLLTICLNRESFDSVWLAPPRLSSSQLLSSFCCCLSFFFNPKKTKCRKFLFVFIIVRRPVVSTVSFIFS